MFVSVGVRREPERDLNRIEDATAPEEHSRLRYCAQVLVRWLKFDPQLQGVQPTAHPIRRVVHGPLVVFFWVRAAEDRYAEVIGYARNLDWEP